jgi:radical SAM protein with 4Fe4S-binding SPASM domain
MTLRGGVHDLPDLIEIEPTDTCNLRCRMCHVSYMSHESRPALDIELIDRLTPLAGRHFILGAGFEPMMNRHFSTLIRKLTAIKAKLHMVTNGTLIDDEALEVLADADFRQLTFSFDGIRKETYEHIRRRAKHGQAVERILKTRERFRGRDTFFAVNSTMMRRNLDEIDEMVDFWDAAGFDDFRMITMVIRQLNPELLRESLYPVREEFFRRLDAAAERVIAENRAIMLHHPYYQESPLRQRFPLNVKNGEVKSDRSLAKKPCTPRTDFSLGQYIPGVGFPCKSPWTHARIKANGDVELCNLFAVGNLREKSFEEIWFGGKAEAVRFFMKTRHEEACPRCDYYKFCLSSAHQKVNDAESYLSGDVVNRVAEVDFENGTLRAPSRPVTPAAEARP